MTTTTETRVPSPEIAQEAPAAHLPTIAPEKEREAWNRIGDALATLYEKEKIPFTPPQGPFDKVVEAVAAVMAEIQSVTKGGQNTHFGYKYARMQDILQALTPLMGKHGIVVFQYEKARTMFDADKVMGIVYDFVVAHKSGQTWVSPVPQTGMAPCRHPKSGLFDDKCMAKCHTSARKYFLLSLFQIPTEDEADPDGEKPERAAAPVPSPDGHVAPHYVEPRKGETFETWTDRYLAGARTARSLTELNTWDAENDDPLSQMQANPKGRPAYDRILQEFKVLRAKMQPQADGSEEPVSTGLHVQTAEPTKVFGPATEVKSVLPFVRPADCPNAERDPDAFVVWATKRLNEAAAQSIDLNEFWEIEIAPAAEGLFKPDWDALGAHRDSLIAKMGG